jgi:hypothetical protein
MKIKSASITGYFTFAVLMICGLAGFVSGQPEEQFGKEVKIFRPDQFGLFSQDCLQIDTMVYNEESLNKLLAFERCVRKELPQDRFDLKKQTIIGYSVGGDCLMSLGTKLYRDDDKKLFTFVMRNIWGGCRAGGWKRGLFAIDKIPSDYRVKFVEYLVEEYPTKRIREHSDSGAIWTADGQKVASEPAAAEPGENAKVIERANPLETREIDLKDCIWPPLRSQMVIKDDETFQKNLRTDAQKNFCGKELGKIDFSKYSLLGIDLDTGYCRTPVGLEYKAFRDDEKKQVTLKISYIEPHGTCRAMSSYNLWVLVPKIPEGYEAKFEVKAVGDEKSQ